MTKFKKILTVMLVFVMVLTLSPIQANAAKKVKLNKSKISMFVGKSYTLKLKNNKKKIKWSSSKKKVATVSKKGKVKAKKKGTCKITAKVGKKKYVCKVTVKKKISSSTNNDSSNNNSVTYGSINGNITYFYNNYIGNRADTGAKVILIPKDGYAKNATLYLSSSDMNNYHVYVGTVDGTGKYEINHVVTGDYFVLIISSKTSYGAWFEAYDETISSVPESYYDGIVSEYYPTYLTRETALNFGKSISFHKFYKNSVKIYENESTTLSYDFGITYI